VTDPSGAAIPAATVSAVSVTTGRAQSTESSSAGYYTIDELPVGLYTVTVTKSGFQSEVATGVRVVVNTATRLDLAMRVGTVTQRVQVTAAPALLQADTTELGSTLDSSQILELPLSLAGTLRSDLGFITLSPGAYAPDLGDSDSIRVGGGLGRSASMLLDGGETTTASENDAGDFKPISVEAVQQFKVQTGTYSAEYGHAGNGVWNFASKSGSNQIHAAFFEYLRNTALNARGFYSPSTTVTHQNDFGFTVGGPVYLPHVYDGRDKLFFFFALEESRFVSAASTGLTSVPTDAMRQGDFGGLVNSTGTLIPIYDPATVQTVNGATVTSQFPGNIIPTNRLDPQAQALVALLPPPSFPGIVNNINVIGNPGETDRVWSTKIDFYPTPKNHFAGLISENDLTTPPQVGPVPGPLGEVWTATTKSKFFRLSHDYTFTPTFLNHFLASVSTIPNDGSSWNEVRSGANRLTAAEAATIALKGAPGDAGVPGTFSFSDGYPELGGGYDSDIFNESWQIGDTVDKIKGAHDIKFGFEYLWMASSRIDKGQKSGAVSFCDGNTGLPGATFQTGWSIASLMLGQACSSSYSFGDANNWGWPYYAMFVQDDWKVTRKLTVNMGLRYEIPKPAAEKYGNTSIMCQTCSNPAAGGLPGAIIFGGSGPGRDGKDNWTNARLNAWGPRLGMAYLLKPNTVLRAGGGIYYEPVRWGSVDGMTMGFAGDRSFSAPNSWTASSTLAGGLPPSAPPPTVDPTICTVTSSTGCNPNYQYPYSGHAPRWGTWNATVEHRLGKDTTFTAAYQGSAGVHIFAWQEDADQLNPKYVNEYGALVFQPIGSAAAQAAGIKLPYANFPTDLTVGQALTPFPQYYGLTGWGNTDMSGHSTFHALEFSAEHQTAHGLWLQAAYTWSKLISNVQYEDPLEGIFDPAGDTTAQNTYDRLADKSVSPDDTPHRIVLAYVYNLPVGRSRRFLSKGGVTNVVLGGWRVSGIQQYQSGFPLRISSNQLNGVGTGERADLNSGVPLKNPGWNGDPNATLYVNPAAFSRPAYLTFGNTPRYFSNLRSPGLLNEDFSVGKDFFFGSKETPKLTFMANFFNAFNRVRFGLPNTTVESPSFGAIGSQLNDPREIQFALRLEF